MSRMELASVLRDHSIAVKDAHIEAALRDPEIGPALAEWAQTHLTTDTLLTLDELDLYDALQRSGRDEELAAAAAPEGGSKGGVPLTDAELRAATAALEASTASIAKQADVLRQQQEAVARLVSTTHQGQRDQRGHRDSRAAFEARHRQQWDSNRADIVATVEGLARNLDLRIDELSQQNMELAQRVQQTVDSLCRSDDKLLASLQKLGWALPVTVPTAPTASTASTAGDPQQHDEDEQRQQRAVGRLRDICLHLIKLAVETIRTRLDRLYLEALEAAQAAHEKEQEQAQQGRRGGYVGDADDVDDGDVSALQEELESLYSEILPVAQMSVEQQYLEPALKSVSGKNGRNLARSLLALDYIDECLDFLMEHIALLTVRIETAAAHHATAETLITAARTELAVQVPVAAPSAAVAQRHQKRLSNYGSPVRRHMSSLSGGSAGASASASASASAGAGASAGPSGAKGHRRRSFGFGNALANVPPIEQLLESLSILLPEDTSAPTEGGVDAAAANAANAKFLHATLVERLAKADGVAAHAQEAFEAASASHVADARRAVWLARESVLGESPYGQVHLVDPEIDGSIAVMAQEVERLRTHLRAVNKEIDKARRVRSAKREQITARWGV